MQDGEEEVEVEEVEKLHRSGSLSLESLPMLQTLQSLELAWHLEQVRSKEVNLVALQPGFLLLILLFFQLAEDLLRI